MDEEEKRWMGGGVYVGWEGALKGLVGIDLLQTIDHARRAG